MSVLGILLFSAQLVARCSKVRNNLTSAQVTSDPGRQVKVMCGGWVDRVTAEGHGDEKTGEEEVR